MSEQNVETIISNISTADIENIKTSKTKSIEPQRHKGQNYFAIWINANIDLTKKEFENSLMQLHSLVHEVHTCTTLERCVEILNTVNEGKALIISSETLGQHLLPKIHGMRRVYAIYIYSSDQNEYGNWTKDWRKVRGVFSSIDSVFQPLEKITHECDHNDISMSFLSKETATTVVAGDSDRKTLDQLPPSYVYSFMFKEIILQVDDDYTKQMNDLVDYCRRKGVLDSQLVDFQEQYHLKSPIFWYTKDVFIYRRLNEALRSLEMEGMVKMGFFIRHLHLQLQQLHNQ